MLEPDVASSRGPKQSVPTLGSPGNTVARRSANPKLSRRSLLACSAVFVGGAAASFAGCSADPRPPATASPVARRASPTSPLAALTVVAGTQATAQQIVTPTPTAVAPTPTPAPPTPTPMPTRVATNGRVVLAYYVPYDSTSWVSLQAHADQIDYVATQTVFANACGDVTMQDDRTLQAFAKTHQIGVLPSIFTYDRALNHRLLTDQTTTARTIRMLTNYVVEEGYAGLDVDLEDIAPDDRDAFTAFVRNLAAAMHSKGKILTMAVVAKTSDTRTGLAGAYDYAALGHYVDRVTIMTYDYSWAGGPPGSIAPYDWVNQVIGYATSQFPPEKVLLGVGFYGYDWNLTTGGRARSLRYPQAEALARQYDASIGLDPKTRSATFRYAGRSGDPPVPSFAGPRLNHDIQQSATPLCSVRTPTPRPSTSPPWTLAGQHAVWLEDAQSFQAQLEIAGQQQTGGIAAWRLGQEDPAIWHVIREWR